MAWAPAYVDESELRAYLRISDPVDDPEISLAVEAASRAIDHATNRQFGLVAAAEARTYETWWSPRRGLYVADIDDLMTTDNLVVTVSSSPVASSAYELTPANAAAKGRPWTRIGLRSVTPAALGAGPDTVAITAEWGWSAVPDTIKQATLIQASRVFARQRSPFGVAGSPELGNELRLLAKVDPDVAVLLQNYRRDYPMLVV